MGEENSIVFRVDADDKEAEKKLNSLRKDIERTQKAIDKTNSQHNGLVNALETAKTKAKETAAEIKAIKDQIAENDAALSGRSGSIDLEEFNARKQAQAEMTVELKEQQKELAAQEKIVQRISTQEEKAAAKLKEQTQTLERQKSDAGAIERVIAQQAGQAMPQLKAAAEAASASIRTGFKNILKWGLGIRTTFILIRKLKNYIKEAVSAFAEQDAETRNTINNLKSSLKTLKLSWGAAFAPILNVVAPFLQKLIGWLTTAANAVNMFFSALSGKSTYKKVSASMGSVASSAGDVAAAEDEIAESAEEAKKQIMGFDEINKLDDMSEKAKTSRNNAGGATGDLVETEEAMINPKMMAFVDWLKKHLEEIKILAGAIAAILLAWKLSKLLGTDFQNTLGIIMTIYGAVLLVQGALDAWQNGVNWDNLKMMLGGIAIAALGLLAVFGPIGAAIALLVGGITLLILGFKDLITTGELTNENMAALAIGMGLVGAAIAILTGSWIPLIIAAVVALVLLIIKNWDEIKEKTIEIWNEVTDWLSEKWEFIKEKALEYFGGLLDGLKRIWEGIKEVFQGIIDFVVGIFTGDWERAWNGVVEIFQGICDQIGGIIDSIIGLINGIIDAVNAAVEAMGSLGEVADSNAQWNEQSGALYATDPSQVNWSTKNTSSDPKKVNWHAKGGIAKRASIIGVGEAGREAVLPLDRNTGWIRDLAGQILGQMDSILPPMPAMAMGQVVPPNANQGGGIAESDLARIIAAIQGIGNNSARSGSHTAIFNVNGREFARAIYDDQQAVAREHGISLISD